MKIDDKVVYPYILVRSEGGEIPGFDVRPIATIQRVWLKARKATAVRSSAHELEIIGINVHNGSLCKKAEEYGADDETLQGFKAPPVCCPEADEMLNLNGIPSRDGYGSVVIEAIEICGIHYADHELLVSGEGCDEGVRND